MLFRIHTQSHPDQCTSCALDAIAEFYLQKPLDDEYLYNNSKDDEFGVTAQKALSAAIHQGVKFLDSEGVVKPFVSSKRIWGLGFLWFPDMFDSIVTQLAKGKVFCGCYWQTGWDKSVGGVLVEPTEWQKVAPHAFAVFDTVEINGVLHLKIQNSRGTEVGDGGIFYANREVVNHFSFAYRLNVLPALL